MSLSFIWPIFTGHLVLSSLPKRHTEVPVVAFRVIISRGLIGKDI